MHTCAYCDCVVPTYRFKTVRHKKEIIFLCADGGDSSCYNKMNKLKIAQRASLEILHIVKDCKLGVCEKSVKDVFRISKMREIALIIMERIKNNARRITRKSIWSVKRLLYRLKELADIVGLKNQYQQLKTSFKNV
jgi:hypothetical protein